MLKKWFLVLAVLATAAGYSVKATSASDWTRFRGPNGAGVSEDKEKLPAEFGDSKNLKWKLEIPGPGGSSPIVFGDKVFITYWSGYGVGDGQGTLEELKRHLICVDRGTGKIVWDASLPAILPEEEYGGMFAEHGYATHTPVCDGERVYVFFGKSGVVAYDMEGKQVWQTAVGDQLDSKHWGSSSSPIVHGNLLIVPATVESLSLVALDKTTGKEVWRQTADGMASTWGTPILVENAEKQAEIVFAVPGEIWGLNPETGKLRWYCEGPKSNSMCSSVTYANGLLFAGESGPGGGGALAIKPGTKGDVTATNKVWESNLQNRVGTPVVHDGLVYFISNKIVTCIEADTGKEVYRERLSTPAGAPNAGPGGAPGGPGPGPGGPGQGGPGQGGPGGRGGGRRGGMGGQDYSSPVIGDGKIFYQSRNGEIYVIQTGREFKELSRNKFDGSGQAIATPAISQGEIFIRTQKGLYCVKSAD